MGGTDWWEVGWCWCSLRLDDGTRVHAVDVRIPGFPAFFGYVQTPDEGSRTPETVTSLSVTEELGDHGFPAVGRIELTAGFADGGGSAHQLGIEITPTAFGPVLLRNDTDGRVSRFPRAMVTCRTDDGRTGAGWIEWNQPQGSAARATGPTPRGRRAARGPGGP